MMKIGVIGISGGWSSEQLADAVEKKTGFRLIVDFENLLLDLDTGTVWSGGVDLSSLDALMVKKIGAQYSPALLDRLDILRFLQGKGVPVFSPPDRIMGVLNRLSCTITLRNGKIPMPPTIITENVDLGLKAVETYKEAVFKPMFSSKARGMEVISPGLGAREKIENFAKKHGMMYIQKKIDFGRQDLGIVFLGGRYLTTYARCARGDSWNTTIRSGGEYKPFDPSLELIALAQKAQSLFGLDFTCVDVAQTPDGPVVFEVSAFGGFRGIHMARGMNAADLYVTYIQEQLDKGLITY
ncbi:SSU ribosomal protein S6P modification protein [Desulfocicer vacuolatum DSM 3385]|uniref:SSU ribosomal protein S6P modification protein n=2 Tax=Desulfocicer vacuolatum TaxID=2298 RepID=A0A1W2CC67_9BACT|nr:SSU ribosomal protein S6P modification protein [Desulfocicer vacuolatum DSM 3385]